MNNSCVSVLLCVIALGCVPSATARGPAGESSLCPATSGIDTSDWQELRGSRYSFRFPRSYVLQPDRSVDSSVNEWRTADGRTLISDYGFYNGPFSPGLRRLDLIACQTGGNGEPQIVTFRTGEGVGAGLYWAIPGGRTLQAGRDRVSPLALWIGAESPRAEHLPELLAIVRSVRLHP